MRKKNLMALLTAACVASMALVGCASGSSESASNQEQTQETADTTTDAATTETADAGAAAPGEESGFTEYPIFEDEEVGFINLSAVYFQPVPMSNGGDTTIGTDDFDIHLEADISALENTLGFGVGDWVPYLTVDYSVADQDGNVAAEGTFMTMSASDGPHYGANIALPDAGTYDLTITIHSPGENGYLLHTDSETGPGGSFDDYFADGNLTYTFEGWEYTPQEW